MAADLKVFGRAIQKSHSNGRFGLASGHPTTYLPNEGWIRIVQDAFDKIVSNGLLFAFYEAVVER